MAPSENIQIFEYLAAKYDQWFERNRFAYESELLALKTFIPRESEGLEVGVGTGKFAASLGVRVGIEPAKAMAKLAQKQGVKVALAVAEQLPFGRKSFDFVLMVTTLCYLEDPFKALREATRVLRPGGHLIIGMIDVESPPGQLYVLKKSDSEFFSRAHFFPVRQILEWFKTLNYTDIKTCQTLFNNPEELAAVEPVRTGYGEGSFVVISAQSL